MEQLAQLVEIIRDIVVAVVAVRGMNAFVRWRELQSGKDRYSLSIEIGEKANEIREAFTLVRTPGFHIVGTEAEEEDHVKILEKLPVNEVSKRVYVRTNIKIGMFKSEIDDFQVLAQRADLLGMDLSIEVELLKKIENQLSVGAMLAYLSSDKDIITDGKRIVEKPESGEEDMVGNLLDDTVELILKKVRHQITASSK